MFDGSKLLPFTDSTIINYDTNIPNKLILSSDKQYDYAYFDINLMQGTYEFTYLGDNENYYPDYSIKNIDGSVDLVKENNIIKYFNYFYWKCTSTSAITSCKINFFVWVL